MSTKSGEDHSPLLPHLSRCLGTEAPLLGARYARLHYYGPLRHPRRPDLSLAGVLFEPSRSAYQGFPCSYGTPLLPCRHHYPGEPAHVYRRSLRPLFPDSACSVCRVSLLLITAGSASALTFSRPARCSRMLRPRCSLTPSRGLFLKNLNFHRYL